MKFVRRLTITDNNKPLCSVNSCPDLFETETGEYAVVGTDITKVAKSSLPKGFVLSPKEKIVLIPRNVLQTAKQNI
jgi:hypothetical protein